MKKEIQINEYIRTPYSKIEKVTKIEKDEYSNILIFTNVSVYSKDWLETTKTKHSFEIIDLIKVGDYVNNSRVEDVYLEGTRKYIKLENRDKTKIFENRTYNEDIEDVVTKEYFSKGKFIVKEN